MARHLLSTKLADNWVVPAVNISTLRHEIAVVQQLRSVLSQEPLDRRRARLVWPYVDVADALSHALGSECYLERRRARPHLLTGPDKARVT